MTRYAYVLWTSARQQLAYRAEFALRAISMVLFMGVFMALWTTAFAISGQAELSGFSALDMVWYLAMTETVALSSSRVFIEISDAVKAGDLAYTLARPVSYPLYQVANSLGGSTLRFVVNLLTASLVVGIGMGQVAGSWQGLLSFLVMAGLALVLDAFVAVLIGLLAFWIEEVMPVYWIYQKLLFTVGGLFLPLEMFPEWLRRIAWWLPFRYVTYAPARAFAAFEPGFVVEAVLGQVVYIGVMAGLVMLLWNRARRRLVVHGG